MASVDRPSKILNMAKGIKGRQIQRGSTQKVWRQIFLREWRDKRGLSIEGLAEKAGVSPALISLIENGKSAGSPESLEKLAKALDCEIGELLDIEPQEKGSLLRIWVSDGDRPRIKAMADAFSKIKDRP